MCASLKYYLALNEISSIGMGTVKKLLSVFGDLPAIFSATKKQLLQAGLREEPVNQIIGFNWRVVESSLDWQEQNNQHIISIEDNCYPALLREIASPPMILFVKGQLGVLQKPQLAVVGTRYPTPIGQENARNFAHVLSKAGLVITSGLALGVDAAGHQGALRGEGETIAVLGTGLDMIYPTRNRWLAEEIIEGGALVSEFPLSMKVHRHNFPRRNRIISGLSLGVLVVEAAIHSGSLITARFALEQGREVFAMPGSIHNALSKGCHRLLKDGAKLVQCAEDIIEELLPLVAVEKDVSVDSTKCQLGENDRRLLACIDEAPTPVERILKRAQISPIQLSPQLLKLEMKGLIRATAGGYQKL